MFYLFLQQIGMLHHGVFDNPVVTIPLPPGDATQDFQALCSGDVNSSFTPAAWPEGSTCENAIPLAYGGGLFEVLNQTNCGLGNFSGYGF